MRVLYVEDDDNLAFAVEQMLTQAGHSCDRARSGLGAVRRGQERDYDLILLDVMLPDIDGYEVLRQLQEAGIQTPVLIQSGLVERDRAIDGGGFGVDDYLIKPFNRDELIRRVEQAARRGGRGAATASPPSTAPAAMSPPPEDPSPALAFPALSATILAGSGGEAIDCTIVSVSTGGAVLHVREDAQRCPEAFMLAVAGDKSYRCEACWRHGDKLGVKFV